MFDVAQERPRITYSQRSLEASILPASLKINAPTAEQGYELSIPCSQTLARLSVTQPTAVLPHSLRLSVYALSVLPLLFKDVVKARVSCQDSRELPS